jgi:hypothetical protein
MNKRLNRIISAIRKSEKVFFDHFSEVELDAYIRGDPEMKARAERLKGNNLAPLWIAVCTPEELAELEKIKNEEQENRSQVDSPPH